MRLIVGVDPGATAGIALVEANSAAAQPETFSSRGMAFSDIAAWVSERGEPLVVATDKARPPLLARRLAAAFGARLWSPKEDMRQAEKAEAAKLHKTKNDHETDALAAALAAKAHFLDTLEKVERGVEEQKQGLVKKMLITGQAANIETAVEMLAARKQERIGRQRRREKDTLLVRLRKELADARIRNKALETELSAMRLAIEKKHARRNETETVKNIRASMASALARKNATIRELERIIEGSYAVAVNYEDVLDDEEMKNRAVIVGKAGSMAIARIERAGAAALIADAGTETTLPLIEKRKANIRAAGKFLAVEMQEGKGDDFVSWLEAYRERRKEQQQG